MIQTPATASTYQANILSALKTRCLRPAGLKHSHARACDSLAPATEISWSSAQNGLPGVSVLPKPNKFARAAGPALGAGPAIGQLPQRLSHIVSSHELVSHRE